MRPESHPRSLHTKRRGFDSALWIGLILVGTFLSSPVHAADIAAAASLSQNTAAVGEPVKYLIRITGVRQANSAPRIAVDGLDIDYSGASTQVQLNNLNFSASVVHTYNVVPQRAGTFTIPAQRIEIAGRLLNTAPVTLTVQNSGGPSGAAANVNAQLGFAEIVVPKSAVYIGESVPVELRIFVDARVRWQPREPPSMKGEGWTVQPFKEPQQEQLTRDGRVYDTVTFKTVMTPVKEGSLAIGPGELNCAVQIPQARRARPHFDIDDFFDHDIFPDPFGSFSRSQSMTFRAEPIQIEVKALPTANQPRDFSGAVGQFTFSLESIPSKVKVGDPITLTMKVGGRGNFDRVAAPQIAETSGWQSYPASATFKADDGGGLSGTKTFEMAIIPTELKTRLPPVEFSYFDPATEKYVTLRAKEMPVVVEGEPLQVRPAQLASKEPEAASAAEPLKRDILHIRTDLGVSRSFDPLYTRREFWIAQSVPFAAFFAFCGFRVWSWRTSASRAGNLAADRREKNQLRKILQTPTSDAADFYDAAARLIQLETARDAGKPASLIEAADACKVGALDPETVERVATLFRVRDELRYTGAPSHRDALTPEGRADVIETIHRFEEIRSNA